MNYAPLSVAGQVQRGVFPETTREFVFSDGMMGNVSYVAIPYSSPHQAAAEVVANILESPDAQYQQTAADVGYPAIDLTKLRPTCRPSSTTTRRPRRWRRTPC